MNNNDQNQNTEIKDNIIDFETKEVRETQETKETQETGSVKTRRTWKKKKHVFRKVIVILVVVLGVLTGCIVHFCHIEEINVTGTKYYTKQQIMNAVKQDHYIDNSVFLMIRNKISPIETMPFVEQVDIVINKPNVITIKVHDKLRAGCIKYAGKYVYFDKEGRALEVMNDRKKDVPLVTGLTYDNIIIGEALTVKEEERLDQIVKITTLITKNELTISKIMFRADGTVCLKRKDLYINLGEPVNLDAKLSVLPNVLSSVKEKRGTLNLEGFTEESKVITFKKK